jgi:hypothetical protein
MSVVNLFNNKLRSSVTGVVTNAVSGITSGAGKVLSIVDPKLGASLGRLGQAGLKKGGKSAASSGISTTQPRVTFSGSGDATDQRVKLSLGANSNIFYQSPGSKVMTPLAVTNGIIFPYTPKINFVHLAQYTTLDITHTNYDFYSYTKSSVNQINIDAEFTAQTSEEANYVLAVLYFLRAATKMFTAQDSLAGNPPPMVFLTGYGDYMIPNVPCVITQFSYTLPDDVDYITTSSNTASEFSLDTSTLNTRVPVISSFSIILQPIYSRSRVGEFSLEKFARGEYVGKDAKGYI